MYSEEEHEEMQCYYLEETSNYEEILPYECCGQLVCNCNDTNPFEWDDNYAEGSGTALMTQNGESVEYIMDPNHNPLGIFIANERVEPEEDQPTDMWENYSMDETENPGWWKDDPEEDPSVITVMVLDEEGKETVVYT